MILMSLILAAVTTAAVAGTVAYFWNEITDWIKLAVAKVKTMVSGVIYGCKVLVKKVSEGFKEISKHYSKKGTQWQETTVTRTVPESEVPDEIRKKVGNIETDITDEYQEALTLTS